MMTNCDEMTKVVQKQQQSKYGKDGGGNLFQEGVSKTFATSRAGTGLACLLVAPPSPLSRSQRGEVS